MWRHSQSFFLVALSLIVPVGSLIGVGCAKNETSSGENADMGGPSERMGERGGGPEGRMSGRGGGFGPVAANATAEEIFQQKCQGCHGDKGQGGSGPNLAKVASAADANIFKTIHDGKGRMPAFGNQMTEAQMNELVAYVKKLGNAA